MVAPDWPTIGASLVTALGAIGAKMGLDKVRGNGNGALKATVDAHIKDDEGKFASVEKTLERVANSAAVMSEKLGEVAEGVAFIRGKLEKD